MIVLEPLQDGEITRTGRFGMPRIGSNRRLGRGAVRGVWLPAGEGEWRWSAAIRSRGARGVRVHFQDFDAGAGEVWIRGGEESGSAYGPYTGRGTFGDGDFWTDILFQETLYIEYRAPAGRAAADPKFTIPEIFHLWQDAAPEAQVDTSCFLDATCYLTSGADPLYKSDAYLVIGEFACTGALIGDRFGTNTPYLLTAGHCVLDAQDARRMIAYFGYRSTSCGGPALPYNSRPSVAGAELLARSFSADFSGVDVNVPDFALVRLSSIPAGEYRLLGWETAPSRSAIYTSISHPWNLPQQIAFGRISTELPHFYNILFNQGATDFGSSGSPLVDEANRLVSIESYGWNEEGVSICSSRLREGGQTKFSSIYPFVKNWLDAHDSSKAYLTVPPPGSVLEGPGVTFNWSSPTAGANYSLLIGSQSGAQDLASRDTGTLASAMITGLPVDGRTLYVRLITRMASTGVSAFNDYTYTAARLSGPAITGMNPGRLLQ